MTIEELIIFYTNNPIDVSFLGGEWNPKTQAYLTAGDNEFKIDNYNQAILYYTKAIELSPANYYPLSKRGKCYQMLQSYDEALSDLFKSKGIDDNFENNQSIAECYLFKKNYEEAIHYFDVALNFLNEREENDPDKILGVNYQATRSRTLNNQAVCYYNLQQLESAVECTTQGILANPQYSNNYKIRGLVFLTLGKRTEAINDLQNAARLGDTVANDILRQI